MATSIPSREARPASAAWNLLKTFGQTVAFWSILLFVVPALVYRVEGAIGLGAYRFASPAWRLAGVGLFALCGVLGLTSGATIAIRGRGTPLPVDCTRALVVSGPYRYVRNPMAIAGLGQGVAVGLFLGSPLVLAYVLAGLLIWNFGVRPAEEADLYRRFGDDFQRYRRRVRCWRFRWPGYDLAREHLEPPLAPESTAPPGRHILLYDGHCRFCTTQVRKLERLARPGTIDVVDFQAAGVLDRFPGLSHEACMKAMQLIEPDGRVSSGVEAAVGVLTTRPPIGRLSPPGPTDAPRSVPDGISIGHERLLARAGERRGGPVGRTSGPGRRAARRATLPRTVQLQRGGHGSDRTTSPPVRSCCDAPGPACRAWEASSPLPVTRTGRATAPPRGSKAVVRRDSLGAPA